MTEAELRDVVMDLLRRIAPEGDYARLKPDVSFRDQLDIDSIDFMNFLDGLHARVGVDVPESRYEQVASLDACVAYLSRQLADRATGAGALPSSS